MSRTIVDAFRTQAGWCAELGSPFTAGLCEAMVRDLEAGGPTARLVGEWPDDPIKDALPLRLTGALHHMALSDPDGPVGRVWPGGADHAGVGHAWPAARAALEAREDEVCAFIVSPPQTNEVRRSAGLFAGLCVAREGFGGPLDLLELGASAGLNLSLDRFVHRNATWSHGEEGPGAVVIDTQWEGAAPPVGAGPAIRARAACDRSPLNAADPADARRLLSYVWPDQADRLARTRAAIALAASLGVRPEKADAADWVRARLASRAPDALTVVQHSVFLQYPPVETREAITAAIEEAGARATPEAPLAWLRFEPARLFDPDAPMGADMRLDLRVWRGDGADEHRVLAVVDPHGRFVRWRNE